MDRLVLTYGSKDILQRVLAARDRREDFCIRVEGPVAKKLEGVVAFYERYKVSMKNGSKQKASIFSFGLRAMRAPLFWGLCVLTDFNARESRFSYSGNVLRAEFDF